MFQRMQGSIPQLNAEMGRRETVQLAKGLDQKTAFRLACRKAKGDFRGCKYDPKTGKAVLT